MDAMQHAVAAQLSAIDDNRSGRHEGVVPNPGAADHAAAAIHYDAPTERRIIVVEVRADRAIVIAEKIIAIGRASEHGTDRVLHGENPWQVDLIIGVERMH